MTGPIKQKTGVKPFLVSYNLITDGYLVLIFNFFKQNCSFYKYFLLSFLSPCNLISVIGHKYIC